MGCSLLVRDMIVIMIDHQLRLGELFSDAGLPRLARAMLEMIKHTRGVPVKGCGWDEAFRLPQAFGVSQGGRQMAMIA